MFTKTEKVIINDVNVITLLMNIFGHSTETISKQYDKV